MTFSQFTAIVELRTKVVSLSTLCLATLLAVRHTGRFDPFLFALTLIASLCVDMGATGFNSYFDWLRGTDRTGHNRERDKILVHELADPGQALLASFGLYALAGALGIVIAIFAGGWLVPVGFVCMLVGFAYTGGPFPISRTPLGEVFAGGFLGEVLFLVAYFIQAGNLTRDAALAGLASSLFIAGILSANNLCDAIGDEASGRSTLAVLLSRRDPDGGILDAGPIAVAILIAETSLAWATALALAAAGILPGFVLITAIPALILSAPILYRMLSRGFSHETKGATMRSVSRLFILFSAAVAAGFIRF
ncbi:MAG: prenyltransferase [Spirochaetes bacterium]|nr:prenyltransferase [Spirochaetota bacterium]